MTGIRCPFCNAQGLDHLQVEGVKSFQVVYCGQCGAIHGVLPLPIEGQKRLSRQAETTLAEPLKQAPEQPTPAIVEPQKSPAVTDQSQQAVEPPHHPAKKPLTKERIGLMASAVGFYTMAFDPPLCPTCKIDMVEEKVPEGHKEAGQSFWKCPNFQTCKQWLPIRD